MIPFIFDPHHIYSFGKSNMRSSYLVRTIQETAFQVIYTSHKGSFVVYMNIMPLHFQPASVTFGIQSANLCRLGYFECSTLIYTIFIIYITIYAVSPSPWLYNILKSKILGKHSILKCFKPVWIFLNNIY